MNNALVTATGIKAGNGVIHVIDQDECDACGVCYEVCPSKFDAVIRITGGPPPPPLPEDQRKIVRKRKSS